MIDREAAENALGAARSIVAADGGDLVLTGTTDRVVRLRLVLESAECADCVMPRAFLEKVVFDLMAARLSGLGAVEIDDPREH
jgi:hypothetical protein